MRLNNLVLFQEVFEHLTVFVGVVPYALGMLRALEEVDFLSVLLCGIDLVDHARRHKGIGSALAEEHRGIGLLKGLHGVDVVHVEVIAGLEDKVADVEDGEVGQVLVVQGGRHLAAHAGEAAVLHDEGEPFHLWGCLHGGCRAHGLALDAPDGIFGEELLHVGCQADEIPAFAEAHGAVGVALAVAVEAMVIGDDIKAQFLIELAVGEHGDVVAGPAMAEDYHPPAAVGEAHGAVCADYSPVELVAEFGFVPEFLDLVVLKYRQRVYGAVLHDRLARVVVGVNVGVYDYIGEHVGCEIRGDAEKQKDCSYDDCGYHGSSF